MKTIGFIGGGRITRIILQGLHNASLKFDKIVVFDTNDSAAEQLKLKFPAVTIARDIKETASSELVILAVHPPVTIETLAKIKDQLSNDSVLLSLVPKIPIEKITALVGIKNIARMNPSASTIVNKGVNPVAFSPSMESKKKKALIGLFQHLGYIPEISDSKIEVYAVICAMGHTYFNFQLHKLEELAVAFGMEKDEARRAISNMLRGTTETLFNSGLPYSEVADLVPVKPLSEVEETIKSYYDQYLNGIFAKIKP